MSALSPRQMFLLDQACHPINAAFGEFGCYLVGTATQRGSYRDVDERFIMADKTRDKLAKAIGDEGIAFLGLAIGQYLASLTGLPIDFQIQRHTEANVLHPDGYRNPLGRRRLSSFKGDAQTVDMERMIAKREIETTTALEREPACVTNWPECFNGGYDPRCCRFPKSCSVQMVGPGSPDLPTTEGVNDGPE